MNNILHTFTEYLNGDKKLSENTLQSYKRDIEQYLNYVYKDLKQDIKETDNLSILKFINCQRDIGKATSTISRNIVSLKKFYKFIYDKKIIEFNHAIFIESPKIEKKIPKILTKDEVEKLLSQPKCDNNKGNRDKAMLQIMYSSGVRVSELIELNIDNFNIDNGILKCLNRGRERFIKLDNEIKNILNEYIVKTRPNLINDKKEKALFVNLYGNRLTRQGFWKIMKKYKVGADIKKDLTPHTLRHSIAAHMLQSGKDLEYIKDLLGHSDISSTQVYAKIIDKDIKALYDKNNMKF
ncbi:MAG: tyrosine recombinase [Clostridiales bacterium]